MIFVIQDSPKLGKIARSRPPPAEKAWPGNLSSTSIKEKTEHPEVDVAIKFSALLI
jgi:hypothetical protein